MRSANASGGMVMPSALGTNSTSNSGRESHWWPIVGKSSSPIKTLLRPAGSGSPEASVVRATETDGAIASDPGSEAIQEREPVRVPDRRAFGIPVVGVAFKSGAATPGNRTERTGVQVDV